MAKIARIRTTLTELLAFYGREAIVLSFGKVSADSYVRKSIFRNSYQLTCEWLPSWTILCRAFFTRFPSVTLFSSFVNIVYSVNSVYRYKQFSVWPFRWHFFFKWCSALVVCARSMTRGDMERLWLVIYVSLPSKSCDSAISTLEKTKAENGKFVELVVVELLPN